MQIKFLDEIKAKLFVKSPMSQEDEESANVFNKNMSFNSLTPTEEAKDCESYMDALSWALKQDKIHNIAVSGPYGSGKSSVIRTFFREHPNYKCITISLANFKGDDESSKDANNTPVQVDVKVKKGDKEQLSLSKTGSDKVLDSNLEQQIERSIVQQLFYHEKDSEIPNSHFQKIKKQDKFELFCFGLFVILFLLSIFYVAFPDKFWKCLYIVHAPTTLTHILQLLALVTIAIGAYKIIVHIIQITIGLSVKYLHFKNTELALEKKEDKSILNYYIDEIIYFFEETEHNVVVIEDLDRFDNQNIFVKLREINYLINNCKKIEHKVVFVYAIKDEMFVDKDRTKFFDFIIPIIPVVNYSNSGEILRRELLPAEGTGTDKNDTTVIHENVIDTLSLFIDDLRLLYNIINEYKIYRNLLSSPKNKVNSSVRNEEVRSHDSTNEITDGLHLIADRLLAIITYKNLYPQDFSDLGQGKGVLHDIITKEKEIYISSMVEKCNNEIAAHEKRIQEIEKSDRPFSLEELRLIYVQKIAAILHHDFTCFIINRKRKTISDCAADETLFNALISSDKIEYHYIPQHSSYETSDTMTFKFHDVEQQIHELTYQQRVDLLYKTELDGLKSQIKALRRNIDEYKQYSIAELMREGKYTIDDKLTKDKPKQQIDFLNVVLREGYINENYWEYISVFYPGSLTYEDKQFVLDVFAGRTNSYTYPLKLVENVLKKITKESTKYLSNKASLNFDLMDYIVSNASIDVSEPYMEQMSSHQDFVVLYIERGGKALGSFINLLCKYYPNFWTYVSQNLANSKEQYLNLIIKHALEENIIPIFKNQKYYLEEYADFLLVDTESEKLHGLISEMDLRFNELNPETDKKELEYIYLQGYYQVNLQMLRVLLYKQDKWDESAFMARNYDYICDNFELMSEQIHYNMPEYIDNVFLTLESQQTITSEHLKKLLNSGDISIEQKKRIIHKSECKIEHISEIEDVSLRNNICRLDKMAATWENIRSMMDEDEDSKSACDTFLNIMENTRQLASVELQEDEDAAAQDDLGYKLMHRNGVNDEAYSILIRCAQFNYEKFNQGISEKHMRIMIENEKVSATVKGFQYIKENYPNLRIFLLEKSGENFEGKYSDLKFDAGDINLIIESKDIGNAIKRDMINSVSSLEILAEENTINSMIQWLLSDDMNGKEALKAEIMNFLSQQSSIDISVRKQLYIKYSNYITEIASFIKSIGKPYSDLVDGKGTVHIPKKDKNLLDVLKEKKYITRCKFTPWNSKYYILREWINIPTV